MCLRACGLAAVRTGRTRTRTRTRAPSQHFNTKYGEYPAAGKPPFKCVPIGANSAPKGEPKLALQSDGSLQAHPGWETMLSGGWRNKARARTRAFECVL